jgi:aspartyl protease family protein
MDYLAQAPLGYIAAAAALLLLFVLTRLPVIGGVVRLLVWLTLIGLVVLAVSQRAALDPYFGDFARRLDLDRQEVVGEEVRIRMAPDGHFYANAWIGGVRRRMLIDSGATVTALSPSTAAEAGLKPDASVVPVVIQTANGAVPARPVTVKELRIGNIVARNLRVVVSPAFGELNVLGMNFLSRLKSWRVEGRMLVLVPNHPQPVDADARDQRAAAQ